MKKVFSLLFIFSLLLEITSCKNNIFLHRKYTAGKYLESRKTLEKPKTHEFEKVSSKVVFNQNCSPEIGLLSIQETNSEIVPKLLIIVNPIGDTAVENDPQISIKNKESKFYLTQENNKKSNSGSSSKSFWLMTLMVGIGIWLILYLLLGYFTSVTSVILAITGAIIASLFGIKFGIEVYKSGSGSFPESSGLSGIILGIIVIISAVSVLLTLK